MANIDIRTAVRESGVRMWQIAEALGIADTTFCRKLRKELSQEEKTHIFEIIHEISKGVD